jgi:hypothetical protein
MVTPPRGCQHFGSNSISDLLEIGFKEREGQAYDDIVRYAANQAKSYPKGYRRYRSYLAFR